MRVAYLDVAPELLGQFLALLPSTMRVIGSAEARDVVRLAIDVTNTPHVGGPWIATVTIDGASLTAKFGPRQV